VSAAGRRLCVIVKIKSDTCRKNRLTALFGCKCKAGARALHVHVGMKSAASAPPFADSENADNIPEARRYGRATEWKMATTPRGMTGNTPLQKTARKTKSRYGSEPRAAGLLNR